MSDVNVLYLVTAVVLGALLVWAGYVLATAPDAPDDSPEGRERREGMKTPPTEREIRKLSFDEPTQIIQRNPLLDDGESPSRRDVAIGGTTAPVVVMPVMRNKLDSHTEIKDDKAGPAPVAGATTEAEKPEEAPKSVSPSGPPLSLSSAIGRSEAEKGPTEASAILDRHRLFILADGSGQKVGDELVSAVLVTALGAAFEADSDGAVARDASLPPRADRLRRAASSTHAVLLAQAKDVDASRVALLAAHFSPDNRTLYLVTSGPDRAYRLRGQDITQLNKPGLAAKADASKSEPRAVETVVVETAVGDVYVFGTEPAFLALGDELRTVLKSDPSIDRVAAHFVAAATRDGKTTGMTAIVVRVDVARPSQRPPTA